MTVAVSVHCELSPPSPSLPERNHTHTQHHKKQKRAGRLSNCAEEACRPGTRFFSYSSGAFLLLIAVRCVLAPPGIAYVLICVKTDFDTTAANAAARAAAKLPARESRDCAHVHA